jgi:hypothetical protein
MQWVRIEYKTLNLHSMMMFVSSNFAALEGLLLHLPRIHVQHNRHNAASIMSETEMREGSGKQNCLAQACLVVKE